MTSNRHDFIRIRGENPRARNEKLAENGVLSWNTSGFIITGAPTRFLDDCTTATGKKIIRVAFVASKKSISKLAVKRNLAKRKMRVVVNNFIRENLPANYDYIFIAKAGIFDVSVAKMSEQFVWAANHFTRMTNGEKFETRKGIKNV
ncbi:MAG: ribonuclease P protein component [Rickettsiales bacterium]|jgi:ribonuclease P protein component|nr:ribonuclease P protein component [Rickettsiales bacterium]